MRKQKLLWQVIRSVWVMVMVVGCIAPITVPQSTPTAKIARVSATLMPPTATPSPTVTTLSSTKPAAGAFVTSYSTYGIFFVVDAKNRDQLAAYLISCGIEGWSLPVQPGLMGSKVPIKNSKFLIDNADVRLSGQFIDPVTVQGTITIKTNQAMQCHTSENMEWTAKCGEPNPFKALFIGGEAVSVESGPCK
ncbi:MAG: hypothetical protein U0350_25065 [Caldilineaceae bacterium]